MKTLKNLIGDSTYLVTDNVSNRFNFFGLIEVTTELVQEAENIVEWDFTEDLPEDVQMAADVMVENDVNLGEFSGIVTFDDGDATYYLLTW